MTYCLKMLGCRPMPVYLGYTGEKGPGVGRVKRPDSGCSSQQWLVWFFSKYTLGHPLKWATCWLFQQVSTNVNGLTACERILSDRKVIEKSMLPG